MGSAGLVGLGALPLLPLPAAASWPFLIASVLLHQAYFTTLLLAYRFGDLSQVYPIARGAAPLLVALAAWLIAGEALSAAQVTGLVIVSGGLISLAWRGRADPPVAPGAVGFALLTSVSIGLYSICDGLGVRRAGDELAYIAWLFVLSGVPILAFTCWRRRGRLIVLLRDHGKVGLGAGQVTALAYGLVIWALGQAPMALVVTLRETGVIFAAAIGALVLKEPFGPRRIAAAAVIVAGAALLHLA